jgi:hypothetical protein
MCWVVQARSEVDRMDASPPPPPDLGRSAIEEHRKTNHWRPSGPWIVVILYTLLALPVIVKDVLTPCIQLDSSAPCNGISFLMTLPGGLVLIFLGGATLPLYLYTSLSFALNILLIYGMSRGFYRLIKR